MTKVLCIDPNMSVAMTDKDFVAGPTALDCTVKAGSCDSPWLSDVHPFVYYNCQCGCVAECKSSALVCRAAGLQAKVGEANAKLESATQAQQQLQGQLEQSKQQLEAAKAQVEQLQQQLQKEQDDKVRCGDTLLGHLVPNMPTVMGARTMV